MLGTLFLLVTVPSSTALAQAMTVIGGNQKAANCYRQAQIHDDEFVTPSSLEDCHYAL